MLSLKKEEKGPLFNQVTLVALSMGKAFPVRFICEDDDEANRVMAKNPDVSLIAQDSEGRCYLADTYGGTVRSSEFKKLIDTL